MTRNAPSIFLIALLAGTAGCGDGLPTDVAPGATFREVSAGDDHTCAVASDGGVWCWGLSLFGRIGQANHERCVDNTCPQPTRLLGGEGFRGLAAGGMHTCAVRDQRASCWGLDWQGQLGSGGTAAQRCGAAARDPNSVPCSVEPALVALGFPTARVTTGSRHSCALTGEGVAWCWGHDLAGQLGDEATRESIDVPVAVSGDHRFVDITGGTSHTCAIDDDQQAWCWGTDLEGRLGLGTVRSTAVPAPVVGERGSPDPSRHPRLYWSDLEAGTAHTCGIATDGLAFCWGLGGHGRLGSELSVNSYPFPVRVRLPGRAISITAGDSHSCAVLEGGAAYCWGRNQHGQLGTGTTANALTPVAVASGESFVQITAGGRHTCAVAADGRLFCWGAGGEGQLGTGDTADQLTPRPVP